MSDSNEEVALEIAGEISHMFKANVDQMAQATIASLIMSVRRTTFEEAAAYARIYWVDGVQMQDMKVASEVCEGIADQLLKIAGQVDGTRQ